MPVPWLHVYSQKRCCYDDEVSWNAICVYSMLWNFFSNTVGENDMHWSFACTGAGGVGDDVGVRRRGRLLRFNGLEEEGSFFKIKVLHMHSSFDRYHFFLFIQLHKYFIALTLLINCMHFRWRWRNICWLWWLWWWYWIDEQFSWIACRHWAEILQPTKFMNECSQFAWERKTLLTIWNSNKSIWSICKW